MQVVESYDVNLCEEQLDLDLEHISCNQGLVVVWGPAHFITYCTKS